MRIIGGNAGPLNNKKWLPLSILTGPHLSKASGYAFTLFNKGPGFM